MAQSVYHEMKHKIHLYSQIIYLLYLFQIFTYYCDKVSYNRFLHYHISQHLQLNITNPTIIYQ
jgi:hypothetical protein